MSAKANTSYSCLKCGICCIFFDIKILNKPAHKACKHLDINKKICTIYEKRPNCCRQFQPDEICYLISTLADEDKILILSKIYSQCI